MRSALEKRFSWTWLALNGPRLDREFKFHPERKWRFDFAYPAARIAVEIEGGVWVHGAHVRGDGFNSDCEKYNAAEALGWHVFRLTRGMINTANLKPILELIRNHENTAHQARRPAGSQR